MALDPDEPFETEGEWWLDGHEDQKVAGWFTWDPEEGGTLRLIGELVAAPWEDNVRADGSVQKVRRNRTDLGHSYPVVHGNADTGYFTLLDCFSSHRHEHHSRDVIREHITVGRALKNGYVVYTDLNDAGFDHMTTRMRHLTEWVGLNSVAVKYPTMDRSGEEWTTIAAVHHPGFSIADGSLTLRLRHWLRPVGDGLLRAGVDQRWLLRLEYPDKKPIQAFIDIASDVQDLVSIAVGKSADFEAINFEHPEVPELSLAGTPFKGTRAPTAYYARWVNRSKPSGAVKHHELYFSLDHFGGIEGLGRWLPVARKYRTELGRAMATQYSAQMYLEDRIMNVCAALDSFDAVRRNAHDRRIDYVVRLRECASYAGTPFAMLIATDVDEWCKKVKELRHDLAHHRDKMRRNETAAAHALSQQVFWLFALCMLREADAPEAVYQHWSSHNTVQWLIRQAATGAAPETSTGDTGDE